MQNSINKRNSRQAIDKKAIDKMLGGRTTYGLPNLSQAT